VLSSVFVDRPRLAIVIAVVTTIAGALALLSIPIAQYPDIVPPQVSVTAVYPGASGAIVDANGCSIDQIAPCSGPASGGTWKNHGQYISAVAQATEAFLAQGLISADQADEIVAQAAESNCGAASR